MRRLKYMKLTREQLRQKRHLSLRRKLQGTVERPRLNVYRTNDNMTAQIIDDQSGKTLVNASTLEKALREEMGKKRRIESAREVGKIVAERAQKAGITKVVFDRGGYRYHGRIKALADGAREGGLQF